MSTPIPLDYYAPFNGQDAFEADWREIFGSWLADGVVAGAENEMLVYGDNSGRQVKVKTGRIRLLGEHGHNTSEKTIALATNTSGNPRIDRIVARAKLTSGLLNDIELDVVAGTPGSSPSPPALTQSGTVWERSLAQVAVANSFSTILAGNVTGERALWSPETLRAYDTVDARDVWIPTPLAGFVAAVRDTGGIYKYDGTQWLQTNRSEFHLAIAATGTEDTSTTPATFPAAFHVDVDVPKWATRCRGTAKLSKILATGTTVPSNCFLTLELDTIVIDALNHIAVKGNSDPQNYTLGGDVDVTSIAGTTVTARVVGTDFSLTSVHLQADANSSCFLEGEFR